jgi:hypothetical protein
LQQVATADQIRAKKEADTQTAADVPVTAKAEPKKSTAKKIVVPASKAKRYAAAGLTDAEVQEQISTEEFKKAEALSKTQKEDAKGFTPAQKTYLAKALEDYAKDYPADAPYAADSIDTIRSNKEEREQSRKAHDWRPDYKQRFSGDATLIRSRRSEEIDPETIIVPDDGTFRITDMQQANRLYQKITGKPLQGKPKEKIASSTFEGRVSETVPGQAKATNLSRAKSLIAFAPDNFDPATVSIPIDVINTEYIGETPVEPSRNNWSPVDVGGKKAYTDGGIVLVSDSKLGPDKKDLKPLGKKPDFAPILGDPKTLEATEPVRAVSISSGRLVNVEFTGGQSIQFKYYNAVKSRFPDATFKGRDRSTVYVYNGKDVVGAVSSFHSENGADVPQDDPLQMSADENVEIPLDSLYTSDGDIDYEQVQNAVNGVLSGTNSIQRLSRKGEQGRVDGGGLLVGSSLIVGGSPRTGQESGSQKERNRQEELLEAYAKDQNAWIDDIDDFKSQYDKIGRGMEAEAYKDGDFVYKVAPVPNGSILRFFDDKIALHNTLPHTVPYELVGFTRDWNTTSGSTFQAVLRQPYIRGDETTDLDPAFVKQMQAAGFLLDASGTKFTGDGLNVIDVANHNVIKGEDGNFYIFDPMASYVDKNDYRPMELVNDEPLQMAAEDGTISLDSLYDENGVNYERVKELSSRIVSGESQTVGLDAEGERGRVYGGQRNVEASLILAASEGAVQKASPESRSGMARRQENLLENYAKREGIWFKPGHFPDRLYLGRGGEAKVYLKDAGRVAKIIDYRHIDKGLTPQTFINNRISAFNALFPESGYELMGFMRDGDGKFRFIVTQPLIQGLEVYSRPEVEAWFKERGFEHTEGDSYTNKDYQVHDLHKGNVLKDASGRMFVIDAVPKPNFEVEPLSIVEPESLQMTASDEALARFKDMPFAHSQTLLEGAKSSIKDIDGKPAIELNEEAAELVRRLQGTLQNKRIGQAYGTTYTAAMLRQLARTATESAAKYESLGYTPAQVKSLRRLANDFLTLANAEKDFGITYTFDFALPHEQRHVLDKRALGGKRPKKSVVDEIVDELGKDPQFKKKYGRKSKNTQAFEIIAAIVNNEDYGWTQEQKDSALKTWADGILDLNPDLDIEKFAEIYDNAKINNPADDTRGRETERDDPEDVSSDRGSSEGTGDGTAETSGDGVRGTDGKTRTERERKVASFSRILGQEYFYDPQSHEDTEVRATQLLSDKGTQQAIYDALYGTPSAEGMRVVQWELERLTGALDNAIRENNQAEIATFSEAAADLSAKIVQRQVAGGQEVEIAKMLVPLSPEAALLTAQKMVEYTKGEGSKLTPDQTETVVRLAQELKDARADIAKQDKKVKTLEKKIDQLKEDRPQTKTARMLRQYQKRKPVLMKELQDLFPDASVFNGEAFAEQSLQMAAPSPQTLTDEQRSKLVEYAAGEILENKPYKTLLSDLDQFTGDEALSKDIHAEAVETLRGDRPGMTQEAKDILKTRNEHYREADKVLKPKGQNQNVKPSIDPNFKKLNDQNVRDLSRVAQRVWAKTADPVLTIAVERLNADPKTINQVIKDIQQATPKMSIADATKIARQARQMLTETKAEMQAERDKLKGILPEQRRELQAAKVAKQKATMKLNKFLTNLADDSNVIKRFNNDMRAKFVSNWGTQLFNVIQSTTVTNPTEVMLDLFNSGLKAVGLDIGNTPDINAKDVLLPMSYLFANNRQMAEFALAEFPDQFFQVHTGLLGDIDIEPVNLAQNKTNKVSKIAHGWFDANQRLNNKLAQITGAKLQEMHFRNAMVAGTMDQIVRRKSKGAETLQSAIENGTLKNFITEEDAQYAADKALRVSFAAQIDDAAGKALKRAYDKVDNILPIFLNPVTYARFTYTATKVMVANPILFGALDSKTLGGKGYDNRSVASGILAWSGIALAYGLLANFGGDDDEWYTLKFGDTTFDIRRTFPLSTYFYMAHLLKDFKDGKPAPTAKDLIEGFASLETDYFTYGPGLELAGAIRDKAAGTKEWSDVGASSSRMLGNFMAGYLRFFKPMRDALAQFDKEEAKLRFYNNSSADKFVQEISKSIPGVARAYGAEVQKDAEGSEILQPFPAGRMFGVNVVHPSFLTPERSTATDWAMRLFRFEGAGGEMSSEDRRAWQMRRTIKNAIRRGTPKEKIEGQMKEYRKRFGERSFDRLRDELKLSEMAAQIKYNFGMTDKKDLQSLKKVWNYATEEEKGELRKVLRAKKNRTAEFNREYGLSGQESQPPQQ